MISSDTFKLIKAITVVNHPWSIDLWCACLFPTCPVNTACEASLNCCWEWQSAERCLKGLQKPPLYYVGTEHPSPCTEAGSELHCTVGHIFSSQELHWVRTFGDRQSPVCSSQRWPARCWTDASPILQNNPPVEEDFNFVQRVFACLYYDVKYHYRSYLSISKKLFKTCLEPFRITIKKVIT